MERIDAADLAEEVTRGAGVELVLSERLFTSEKPELALVYLDHERVLHLADRTVAHREFGEVSFDLETNCPAVARATVGLERTRWHG